MLGTQRRVQILFCKRVRANECGPDGVVGLYSRQNRRLTALLMLQPTRRDEMVMATHPQKWYDIKCSDYFTKRSIAGTTDRELAAMGLRHVRQTTDVCLTQRRVQILMMRFFLFFKSACHASPAHSLSHLSGVLVALHGRVPLRKETLEAFARMHRCSWRHAPQIQCAAQGTA